MATRDPVRTGGGGYELPLLLLAGFRAIIDELHTELSTRGHPDARPAHGFVLQAIGLDGATASEVARRLGVSKQAAGKSIERIEVLGYAARIADEMDGRRKVVRLTDYGVDLLTQSARILDRIHRRWVRALGVDRVRALESDLRSMTPSAVFRLDLAGWLG